MTRPTARTSRLVTDDDLLERCRRGDTGAHSELFERYHDHVYNLGLHFSGDEATAADVTQDVFLKLLDRIRQFRRDAELTTWLYRIVLNTFLDHRRRRRPSLSLEETEAETAFAAPQERDAERDQIQRLVRQATAQLSPRLRAPLVLRYSAGLSYEEIAEVLDVSPGTVASRLSRAHAKLARKLRYLSRSAR